MKLGGNAGFFVLFGLIWTLIVGAFDVMIGYGIYRSEQAKSWPAVTATVLESRVESSRDSDGDVTYRPYIRYEYDVDGQQYESDRYRFNTFGTSGSGRARSIVEAHPVGRTLQAFFNPDNPDDAVLQRGVQSIDLFLLLFLTPFNVIMLGCWLFIGTNLSIAVRKPEAGGVHLVRKAGATFARLPRMSPLVAGGATALCVSFVAIFALGLPYAFDPPITTIYITWAATIGLAIGVFLWKRYHIGTGKKDLVIDPQSAMLSLPQTFGREEDVTVPIDRIDDVTVEVVEHRGNKDGRSHTYAPTLTWRDADGERKSDRLADWPIQSRAESFVAWLRKEIGFGESR